MNRFREKKTFRMKQGGMALSVLIMAASFAVFTGAIRDIQTDVNEKEKEHLEQVLHQSAAMCYSLEGSYPKNLAYLQEAYGIQWEKEKFLVDFEYVGKNLPPDIVVIPLKE